MKNSDRFHSKPLWATVLNLVHQEVEARITQKTVEISLRGKRVASHLRSTLPHRPTTISEHMPSSHRRYRDWTHERIRSEAAKVGPDAETYLRRTAPSDRSWSDRTAPPAEEAPILFHANIRGRRSKSEHAEVGASKILWRVLASSRIA